MQKPSRTKLVNALVFCVFYLGKIKWEESQSQRKSQSPVKLASVLPLGQKRDNRKKKDGSIKRDNSKKDGIDE